MSELYNQAVSKHYQAYRPPIHQKILQQVFATSPTFAVGLDLGCGTGASTVALSHYCQRVHGVDPSAAMLDKAISQEHVRYHLGTGEVLPFAEGDINVVTFAGSLFYAKSAALVKELQRVCSPNAWVVVYDFDVLMNDVLQQLDIELPSSSASYDHAINFADYPQLSPLSVEEKTISLDVSSTQLAHVLFSSVKRLVPLRAKYGDEKSFENVVKKLDAISVSHSLFAKTYISLYRINEHH